MTLAFLISLGIFIAATWTLYPVLRLQYQQQREVASLETELAGLKARNTELSAQVDRLKTPEGVEEVARQSLGLVKDGEHAYVVTGKKNPDLDPEAVDARTRSSEEERVPLWMKVLDAVFGVR
ncbi:MAG: septum formation initiator family protein [Coriobacteriia bacterium]|nr:septum formation initiator family protein [Coriobacteriia bacterium]